MTDPACQRSTECVLGVNHRGPCRERRVYPTPAPPSPREAPAVGAEPHDPRTGWKPPGFEQ